MITTTFEILKETEACEAGYKKLARALGGIKKYGKSTPITLKQIVESNGVTDAYWVCMTGAVVPCSYSEARKIYTEIREFTGFPEPSLFWYNEGHGCPMPDVIRAQCENILLRA